MSKELKAIAFLLICLLGMSCGTTQQLETAKAKKRSVKFLERQLEKNHIDYTWFGSKAKIKFEDKKTKVNLAADVRIQKDSLIWIRIKKMNVEGARIKITPERIEILNRQESEYIKRPFSYIKDEFGLELSFSELQELLVGNPILFQEKELISTIRENQNVLKTPESEKTVLKIFMNPSHFLINEIRGSMNHNSISIEYSDYEEVENQQIPTIKDVHIDSEDIGEVKVKMTYSKMSINEEQSVGFKVPSSYKKL